MKNNRPFQLIVQLLITTLLFQSCGSDDEDTVAVVQAELNPLLSLSYQDPQLMEMTIERAKNLELTNKQVISEEEFLEKFADDTHYTPGFEDYEGFFVQGKTITRYSKIDFYPGSLLGSDKSFETKFACEIESIEATQVVAVNPEMNRRKMLLLGHRNQSISERNERLKAQIPQCETSGVASQSLSPLTYLVERNRAPTLLFSLRTRAQNITDLLPEFGSGKQWDSVNPSYENGNIGQMRFFKVEATLESKFKSRHVVYFFREFNGLAPIGMASSEQTILRPALAYIHEENQLEGRSYERVQMIDLHRKREFPVEKVEQLFGGAEEIKNFAQSKNPSISIFVENLSDWFNVPEDEDETNEQESRTYSN